MKCSLGVSNFLKEISSLSHSIVFLYFFALLITEKGFFYFSLLFFGTLHSNGYIFPFLLCFSHLFFLQLFVRHPQIAILLFHIYFFMAHIMNSLLPQLLASQKQLCSIILPDYKFHINSILKHIILQLVSFT